jgi:hypothetical protein
VKRGAVLEEGPRFDCKTEGSRDERPVQVDLEAEATRDLETDTLPEASLEALSRLLIAAPSAMGAEQRERRVVVTLRDEHVDVSKGAEARLGIDAVCDRWTSEDPRRDVGRVQLMHGRQK